MQRKKSKILLMILTVIICLSAFNIQGFATELETGDVYNMADALNNPEQAKNVTEETEINEYNDAKNVEDENSELDDETANNSLEQGVATENETETKAMQPVDFPRITVTYSYFDENGNTTSTSSFIASYDVNGTNITATVNAFPELIRIPENSFSVIVNGEYDITPEVGYNNETGILSIPVQYDKTNIYAEFRLPETEIAELSVNGKFTVTDPSGTDTVMDEDIICLSNANELRFPFEADSEANFSITALQGDIDLDGKVRIENGEIIVSTSPIGGNISGHAHADYAGKKSSVRRMATRAASSWEELGWASTVSNDRVPNAYEYGKYGSHITSSFSANGNTAYCIQPTISGPPAGTYDVSGYLAFLPDENFSVHGYGGKDTVNKLLYYGLGGPAYDPSIYGGDSTAQQYVITHIALSLLCSGTEEGLHKTNGNALPAAQTLIANVNAKPAPPDTFQAFLYNVGGAKQGCISWINVEPPVGTLALKKVSSNPEITENNSCYSLEGAVFEIYSKSDSSLITTVTTDANGDINCELKAGEYTAKEVKAPKGFKISDTADVGVDFTITSGETSYIEVSNIPLSDPVASFVVKGDKDGNPVPQGEASLAGAQFTVKYYTVMYSEGELAGITPARTWVLETKPVTAAGKTVYMAMLMPSYLVSGDKFYYNTNGTNPIVPLGTLTVQETKAPQGYLADSKTYHFNIEEDKRNIGMVTAVNIPVIEEPVVRGGVRIEKWDNELNRNEAQGAADLKDAEFEIISKNTNSVVVAGKTYNNGDTVYTIETNDKGVAETPSDLLPYGTYEIREKTAPKGYLNSGVLSRTFEIRTNGAIVNLNSEDKAIKNNVIRGGVRIEKWDNELNERTMQGDSTLAGAKFEIISKNSQPVLVNGKEYAKDQVVAEILTDDKGVALTSSSLLPYGEYEIYEKTPPQGYQSKGILRRTFRIENQGVIVNLNGSDTSIKNDVIRGGVRIEKWDNEIDENKAQGGATLKDAEFEIVNRSKTSVLVEDKLYQVGEVIYTLLTDEKGAYETANDLLPYGTYEIRETKAPEGYLHTGVLSRTFEIRENGVIVNLNTTDTAIKNNPIRGDLMGVKIGDGNAERLADVPFKITSLTTGESHTVVTDRNGMFSTSSDWNPHSENTNRGEKCTDGVWFGKIETLNDNLGALLYDDYLLEEQSCEANKDKELLSVKVSIYRHNTTIDLGTLTDDYIVQPEIGTIVVDAETMSNEAFTNSKTVITDTVYYSGLQAWKTYTVKGIIMDRQTEMPFMQNDEEVTAETTFRALSSEGTVALDFTFNTEELDGKSIVVFEKLYLDDSEIAQHEDISDENQTIEFQKPEIRTKATGTDGEKEIGASQEITLVDTVEYKGLIPNETYTVNGTLMDKETGKPIMDSGKEVTSTVVFTPEKSDGVITLEFKFNTAQYLGKEIVAFETLEYKGRELAVHADIEDKDQTVKVKEPEIGTKAISENGEKFLDVKGETKIIDTVSFKALSVGETYTVKGILMDKETEQPLVIDGRLIEAVSEFKPQTESGTVEVKFNLDTTALIDKDIVVFEKLYYKDTEIASHEDISDDGQTVKVKKPKIGTQAAGENGEREILRSEEMVIKDTILYSGLLVGETYTLKGVLMDKDTGEQIIIDGQPIIAEKEFTADSSDGTVEVVFTFNGEATDAVNIVVFESLYYGEIEIASHSDIEDESQTVTLVDDTNIITPTKRPKTGDDTNLLPYLIMTAVSGAAMAVICIRVYKKKKQNGEDNK